MVIFASRWNLNLKLSSMDEPFAMIAASVAVYLPIYCEHATLGLITFAFNKS